MSSQKILWGAIVFSTLIYVVIAYSLAPEPVRPFEESVRAPMTLGMYAAAFAMFVAALVLPARSSQSPARTKMILALALFESCAVLGLAAAFLQHDWRLIIPPWLASLIGFVREWPREDITSPQA